jgi:hypothetical protein
VPVSSAPLLGYICRRLPKDCNDSVEFASDTKPAQREVSEKCQAFAREVVGNDENGKAPSVGERIGAKSVAPTLIGTLRDRDRRSRAESGLGTVRRRTGKRLLSANAARLFGGQSEALLRSKKWRRR